MVHALVDTKVKWGRGIPHIPSTAHSHHFLTYSVAFYNFMHIFTANSPAIFQYYIVLYSV